MKSLGEIADQCKQATFTKRCTFLNNDSSSHINIILPVHAFIVSTSYFHGAESS